MYVRLKKGDKFSEVFPLNGLSPEQMMNDHNADEIHLVKKNGHYHNNNGVKRQKWRTYHEIKAEKNNTYNPMDSLHSPFHQTEENNPVLKQPSSDALQVQVMYLKDQLKEAKSDRDKYKEKFEDFKSKYEKTDRELFEVRQDHKDELRKLEKEQETGLNGFMDKHPEIAIKALEIFGPAITSKMGGQNQLQGLETSYSENLTGIIDYLKEFDETDQEFINTCIILCHLHEKETSFEEVKTYLQQMFNQN